MQFELFYEQLEYQLYRRHRANRQWWLRLINACSCSDFNQV